MRIIVVVGRVLDPRGIAVNRRVERVFVNREEYITEPADGCALEAALRIKDQNGAQVVVLPRGMLPDADVLRLAIAAGADRAFHFVSAVKDLSDLDDAASVRLLAAAVERLGGADLVLAGANTLATGQGQLGPRLAEALGWPQVLGARDIAVVDGRLRAVVRASRSRRTPSAGYVNVDAALPCVVTVAAGSLKPRYPDGVRLINVFRGVGELASALEEWDVDELVAPEMLIPIWERRGLRFPPERARGVRVRGSRQEMARAAANALREHLPA